MKPFSAPAMGLSPLSENKRKLTRSFPSLESLNHQTGLAPMSKIGFVGVGRMGSNMARHLKEKGYKIGAVYDVRTESATALGSELGAAAPERLAEVSALSTS